MRGTNCDLFTHNQSRSYLNHLVQQMWNMKCIITPVVTADYRNSNKRFKEQFESRTKKTFNRFITKDSCTCNITHNTESTAVWNLKHERWGSQLVEEEKWQREKGLWQETMMMMMMIIMRPVYTCKQYKRNSTGILLRFCCVTND
jgi:hypothetical protein